MQENTIKSNCREIESNLKHINEMVKHIVSSENKPTREMHAIDIESTIGDINDSLNRIKNMT